MDVTSLVIISITFVLSPRPISHNHIFPSSAAYKLMHRDMEQINTFNVIVFSSLWLATFSGAVALTIQLSTNPGICEHFSRLDGGFCALGISAVAITWSATVIGTSQFLYPSITK
jgi:hypothetical protein